jgi:hypothetical protein
MNLLKTYLRQPSTWLGIAKIGAAAGIYSTGVGNSVATVIVSIFGIVDVIRNERSQPKL